MINNIKKRLFFLVVFLFKKHKMFYKFYTYNKLTYCLINKKKLRISMFPTCTFDI